MQPKLKLIFASIVFSIAWSGSVMAIGSMRCGTHIISADPSRPSGKYEVLKRCGEPDSRQGNTWIYERGSVTRTIRFDRNGRILEIR